MAIFGLSVGYVLGEEGDKFVNNPKDRGGATKYGISQRLLKSLSPETLRLCEIFGDVNDVSTIAYLSRGQAQAVYFHVFWSPKFEEIHNQQVCNYLFSMSVHIGVAQAVKLLQRATWALSCDTETVKDDGVFGKVTLSEINKWNGMIMAPLRAERANFYYATLKANDDDKEFIHGWIKRTYK